MELKIDKLVVSYGKKTVLDNFDYVFTPGIYGLLGPNGAGKTTLMKAITDNLIPKSGEIYWENSCIHSFGSEYRKIIGFMPQRQNIYPYFTVENFLWYMASLKGLKKEQAEKEIDKLLDAVHLSNERYKKMGRLSGGMKQRALLAQALLGSPQIIILDEPTVGLDPKERIRMRNLLSKAARNSIILITTHIASDVQFIAKDIIIMNQGKITDHGAPEKLCNNINGLVYEMEIHENCMELYSSRYKISNIYREAELMKIRIITDNPPKEIAVNAVKPDLEDVYLYYFG